MGFVTQLVSWLRRPAEAPLRRPLKRLHFETLEERTLLDASFPELVVDPQVFAPSSLLVSFQDGAAPADVLPDGASLGDALPLVPGLYEVQLGGSLTVAAAMEALRANPLVRFAEPDYEVHVDFIPNDTFFGSLWGLHNTGQSGGLLDADIDAPEAWDVTMGSGSVIVAVIDTGVDYNHPDLAANIWTNFGEIAGNGRDDDFNGYVDDVHGYDFYSNDGNPMDGNGHGTHVAGTIGAVANNARGVAGVNPNVRIMALQFMSASGSGFTSDAVRAINYAVANGASISNNSWGGGGFSTSLFNAIANARAQGHIFVAAAGNNGSNNDFSPHYPSNYNLDNVVSVAATDRLDNLAWFSNYGATTVDLGAPGVSILSTYPGNRYATLSGTSMASPHVAGALALIRDLHPEYTYLEAINQLLSSVDPLPSLSGLMVSGGRLNVANALAGPSLPRISINDVSVLEGNSGTVDAVFTVTLSAASSDFVTVDYATANGTATAGSDYEAAVGTVTFVPGETSQTVAVTVNGDTTPEPNETFFVNLSNPSGATLLDGQGVGTIRNDDLPSLSIDDTSVTEGNSGTVDAVFTVTLSAASSEMVSAFYATANGTATAGSDYVTTSGTVSFAPGETSKTVAVAVNGDTALEPNETFFVNLLIPVGATLLDDQGVGTIRDDDLVLSIDDVTVTEGNSGTVDAVFTVTLSAASSDMVTADYATANGTATAGSDYVTTSGTVSFAPGETSQTVAVTVNGDLSVEPNETFFVNLSNPVGAALLDGQGVGTIQNDDVGSLRINDASVIEGNSGTVNLVFTVSLPGPAVAPVTFDFATGPAPGSSADQATAGTDYYSASGQATIPAGQSSRTIAVTVRGDTTVERHERFAVNLSNAVNASIADGQGVGTIRNDDTTIAIADTSVLEGNSGFKNAVFTVSLAQPSALSVSVRYTTINNTAIGWSDYLPQSGTLVFQPGQTQKTISISVIGDRIFENNETFFVFLNSPTNAGIVDGVAVGTILNDDGLLFGPSSFGGFSPFGRHRR